MSTLFSIYEYQPRLVRPYALSFGTLTHFDTFIVGLESEEGIGLGEVTPLPGYGHETPDLVREGLQNFVSMLERGTPYETAAANVFKTAPMTGSGLFCALETLRLGRSSLFAPLDSAPPLAAFCAGDTPETVARTASSLVREGYTALKLKVGRMQAAQEVELVRAACSELPEGGSVRVDANQRSAPDHALALCRALEGLPVAHFEQPFAPDAWKEHEALARQSPLPILLDESIETLLDIRRTAQAGISAIKLKLCKHAGLAATREMIEEARKLGLDLIFGNGVQTALGNHLEARLALETGIDSALESNGFAKVANPPLGHDIRVDSGRMVDGGLLRPAALPSGALLEIRFSRRQLSD